MPDLLLLPIRRFTPKRYRPGNLGTWSGHLPFAADLIADLCPQFFVELGTHYGESYFGFCQAVQETNAPTRCLAVDTWQGDQHAGLYGEEVFHEVNGYNDANYKAFSSLMRCAFDEASEGFAPESIDVLHIDGLHTYDAVKHDFETWFPKVKPGGIVLFHDTAVTRPGFEVWRFWEELKLVHRHFAFTHCWGLGLIQKSTSPSRLLDSLFNADARTTEQIRRQYEDAAELLEHRLRTPEMEQAAAQANRPYLQLFPVQADNSADEATSVLSSIQPGIWQDHILRIPGGAPGGTIRVDPLNCPGAIEISAITVRDSDGHVLTHLSDADEIRSLYCARDLVAIATGNPAQFLSLGTDPQFHLPVSGAKGCSCSLQVEISMRMGIELQQSAKLATGLAPNKVEEIVSRVDRFVTEGKIAGAVLLIAHKGVIAVHHAFGWMDREAGIPMRRDALFYVLSMTKAITCATLLTLEEEGLVSLDHPIERWLPEYKNLRLANGDKPAEPPRLSQCMSHSAGLTDAFPESFLKMGFTLPELVSVGARNPLGYEPGHGWAYCNLGFAILGRIIELASQRSYLEMVQDRILRPVGMANSFFHADKSQANRLAAVYKLEDNVLRRDQQQSPFANLPEYVAPENGLITSALDLWRFYEMIRQEGIAAGNRVLSKSGARAMTAVQTGNHNAGFLPGMGYGYGLSLITQPSGMFRNHSPGTFGHGSYYQEHAWVDPAKDVSAVFFQHTRADGMTVTPELTELVPLFGALKSSTRSSTTDGSSNG